VITIVDHDRRWPESFATIGATLRDRLGHAAIRIDHIGSTAVDGLAAKDVIDIQVTVAHLDVADVGRTRSCRTSLAEPR
jgi:dephospho-CoA kinase